MTQMSLELLEAPVTFTACVAAYLKARPLVWVDGRELATVGGAYAWRSRLSDARRAFGMVIENKQVRQAGYTASLYRWVPDSRSGGETAR